MPVSARVIELEKLRQRIIDANACLGSFDGWDRWGRSSSDAAQVEAMEREAATAQADRTAAKAEIEKLVAVLRAEAPHEIVAWADAHDALLAGYLASDASHGPYAESSVQDANEARAAWAEVKAGTRTYVDAGSYAETRDKARFLELLGIACQ